MALPDRVLRWFEHLAGLHVRRVWLRRDVYDQIVRLSGGYPAISRISIHGVEVHERERVGPWRQRESFHVVFTSDERVW